MSDPTSSQPDAYKGVYSKTVESTEVVTTGTSHRMDCGSPMMPELISMLRRINLMDSWDLSCMEGLIAFGAGFTVTAAFVTCASNSLEWRLVVPIVFAIATSVPRFVFQLRDSRVTGSSTATALLAFLGRISMGDFIATLFAQLAGAAAGVALGLVTVAGTDFSQFTNSIAPSPKAGLVGILVGGGLCAAMDACARVATSMRYRTHAEIVMHGPGGVEPELHVYSKGLGSILSSFNLGIMVLCACFSFAAINSCNGILNPFIFFALTFFKGPGTDVGWNMLLSTIGAFLGLMYVFFFSRAYNLDGPVIHDESVSSTSTSSQMYQSTSSVTRRQ